MNWNRSQSIQFSIQRLQQKNFISESFTIKFSESVHLDGVVKFNNYSTERKQKGTNEFMLVKHNRFPWLWKIWNVNIQYITYINILTYFPHHMHVKDVACNSMLLCVVVVESKWSGPACIQGWKATRPHRWRCFRCHYNKPINYFKKMLGGKDRLKIMTGRRIISPQRLTLDFQSS